MKKLIITVLLFLSFFVLEAQNYNPIINYAFNGTPKNGIKIKTNIPFIHGYGMPTLIIEGYAYGGKTSIGIMLNWYVFSNNFYTATASSFGGYTPEIKLYNENGKVTIFINDKKYFHRFTIRGYAKGKKEKNTDFHGWVITDELPKGTNEKTFVYKNRFEGNIFLTKGIWNSRGNVGIGTTTPDAKLSVNGNIHSKEVKVDLTNWPDYVFSEDYNLPSLEEVEIHIKEKGHLSNIPSAKEVSENGVQLGEMNKKLLQKIEELTLYTIQQQKQLKTQKTKLKFSEQKNVELEKRLSEIEKLLQVIKAKN